MVPVNNTKTDTHVKEEEEGKINMDKEDGTRELIKEEIIQESKYPIRQKIKRAGGGVAYMLGE